MTLRVNLLRSFYLLLVFCLASLPCPANDQTFEEKPPHVNELVGIWELYKDDDKPDETLPDEKLLFYEDGRLLMITSGSRFGYYEPFSDHIEMIFDYNGREIMIQMKYVLNNGVLQFVNEGKGYVYYRKIEEDMPVWRLEDAWERKDIGNISLKVPNEWKIIQEPPNEEGHQRLLILNADASKTVMIVRAPSLKRLHSEVFSMSIKKLIHELSLMIPIDESSLKKVDEDLFGIKGPVFCAETKNPSKIFFKAVNTETPNAIIILCYFYQYDRLSELNKITRSIEIDDTRLSVE